MIPYNICFIEHSFDVSISNIKEIFLFLFYLATTLMFKKGSQMYALKNLLIFSLEMVNNERKTD